MKRIFAGVLGTVWLLVPHVAMAQEASLSLGGCHPSQWASSSFYAEFLKRPHEKPVVHQGWEARYQYDEKNRRLHPYYGNRRVGKSVGRDERGNLNYKIWWRNQIFTENLLKQDRR